MKPVKHSHLNILLIAALLVALSLLASTASAGAPPTLISYQGLVKVSGVPYDGTGYFRFAIVNAATNDGTSYWQTGPEALTVSNGLFDFMLGSTTALPSGVLDRDPIYLRVWFSQSSGGPFQALEPNQRIGSVAYALRAEHATTAGNADTVDSQHASDFAASSHAHSGAAITSGTIDIGRLPAIPWSQLSSVPAGFADGADNDALGGMSCANGQIAKYNGSVWACAADSDTTYAAGSNLNLVGTTFALANDVSVSGSVAAGSYVKVGVSATSPANCDSSKAGAVYLDSSTSMLQFCNGSTWQAIGATPQIAFQAESSGGTLGTAWQDLSFATEVFDDGNAFSSGTGVFTAPSAGTYRFECQLTATLYDSGAVDLAVAIFRNGIQHTNSLATVVSSGGFYAVRQVSTTVKAIPGDTFNCRSYKSGGLPGLILGSRYTHFAGYRIY